MDLEDQVVAEIPVFMSKELMEQLYLIQHPLRPVTSTFEDENILEAKIKPQQDKIQLTLEVDTHASRYDRRPDKKLARQRQGAGWDEDLLDEPLPDEHVMESVGIHESTKSPRYLVGLIRGGQVHLTPLKSIVQMRPIFPHLNKTDAVKKTANTGLAESAADTEDETEEEATKVTVKFQNRNHGGKDRQSKSYNALKKKQDDESWIYLSYEQEDQLEYEKLCSGNRESETPFYVTPREEYLETLFPKHTNIDVDSPADKKKFIPKRLNLSQLRLLSLPEQLRAIMLNGSVLHYAHVVDFLRSKLLASFDDVSLLRTIQTVAILVQGCWVVRSDLAFGAEFVSSSHGIPGSIMQRARDIILHQFTQRRRVDRRQMCALTHLPNEEVTDILSKIAHWRPSTTSGTGGWEFLQLFDSDFVGKHPDVVQRQTLILEMKITNKNRSSNSGSEKTLKPIIASPPPRRSSRTKSFSSDTDSGAESDGKGNVLRRQRSNSSTTPKPDSLLKVKIESIAEPN